MCLEIASASKRPEPKSVTTCCVNTSITAPSGWTRATGRAVRDSSPARFGRRLGPSSPYNAAWNCWAEPPIICSAHRLARC